MADHTPAATALRTAAATHVHALAVLDEWSGEQEKIYAVASGGVILCDGDTTIQSNLFMVIKDIAEDAVLPYSLRGLINDLARAAGSDYVEDASHG